MKTRCWNGWSSADRINDSFGISAVAWAEYLCGPLDPAGETLARSMFPVPEIFTEPDAVLAARLFNQTGRRSRSLAEDIKEAAPDVTPSRIISYVGIRQVIPGRQSRLPEPTDEANRCNLGHVTPKTLQKALYVGFYQISRPLQVVCLGWSQFPIPEVSSDRYLDAVERDLPRRLLELPGTQ